MHKAIFSLHFAPHTIVSIQIVSMDKSNVYEALFACALALFSNGAQRLVYDEYPEGYEL